MNKKLDIFLEEWDNATGSRAIGFDKLFKEVESALKLQELVKESTTQGNPPIIAGYLLQLIEESKK